MVAVIAVILAAAVVASLLTISFDIRERMGLELRNYGANVVVLPGGNVSLDNFDVSHPSIVGYVPYLYFRTEINGKNIDAAGTDLEAANKMNPWWHIEGSMPGENEVLAGIIAAEKLGVKTGDELQIKGSAYRVSGVLDTGTSDDIRIFMPVEVAKAIAGSGKTASVQLSVLGDVDAVVEDLKNKGYDVKKIRQVAYTESALLRKTQLLMSLVAVFVLIAACLSLMSTMVMAVLERSREIGLMKALGSGDGTIAALFFTEAAIMGTIGGIFGYFAGLFLARFISIEIFNMPVSIRPEVFMLTLLISIAVALMGSILPVSRAVSMDPVNSLRGE